MNYTIRDDYDGEIRRLQAALTKAEAERDTLIALVPLFYRHLNQGKTVPESREALLRAVRHTLAQPQDGAS